MSAVPAAPSGEQGHAGLTSPPGWGFFAQEGEHAAELRWPMSIETFHRMRTDAQIDALTSAVTLPLQRLKFVIDPNGASDEVVEHIANDLGLPVKGEDNEQRGRRRFDHGEHLSHALLALWYGHMFFEQVPDTERYDLAEDGWHLRKLAPRMPQSIQKIDVADDGGLKGIWQPGGKSAARQLPFMQGTFLGVDRIVAYVWRREGANWVGRSMLRPLYRPWLLKDRMLRIDAIKNERFGAGIPTGEAPPGGDPVEYQKMAQAIRASDQSGVGLPSGGSIGVDGIRGTLPDTLASIRYYDEEMARSFLAMMIQLGQTETGSRALGETFSDFFQMSIEAVADWYVATTNRHVIEDIVDWSYGVDENAPLIAWEYPDHDFIAVSDLISLTDAGLINVGQELSSWVRERWGLPLESVIEPEEEVDDDAPLDDWAQEGAPGEEVAATSRRPFVHAHLPGQHDQRDHGKGTANVEFASQEEWDAARAQAEAKIAAAPVPSQGDVDKARADLENASRAGGDSRGGSAKARRKQRENLFKEFGGEEKGYVVDHATGMKMHHSADPELNPNGYPLLERGKIFVKRQGGAYRLPNLLPESFAANRGRGDDPVRTENLT